MEIYQDKSLLSIIVCAIRDISWLALMFRVNIIWITYVLFKYIFIISVKFYFKRLNMTYEMRKEEIRALLRMNDSYLNLFNQEAETI